jgi:hypothetical protein
MRWLSLLLLLSPRLAWATSDAGADAGVDADVDDPLPVPTIAIEKGKEPRLVMEGLPAVSADGRIAFIAARGEYNDSGKIELRIASPDGVVRRLPLERTDSFKQDPTQPSHLFRGNVRRAQALLGRGVFRALPEPKSCVPPNPPRWKPSEGFHAFPRFGSAGQSPASPSRLDEPKVPVPAPCRCLPLPTDETNMPPVAVGPFLVAYDDESEELRIYDASCEVVVRRKAAIAKRGYCCGEPEWPGDRCTVGWELMDIRGDGDGVFVEGYGAIYAPDGCELDRQYVVAWPAQRSARESDNWNPLQRRKQKP